MGSSAPIAAAMGSSIKNTCFAPALSADSRIALFSTCVAPYGTQMTILGLGENMLVDTVFLIKCLIISSVILKSAITPSFIGRIASILWGDLPSIDLASAPTARTVFLD